MCVGFLRLTSPGNSTYPIVQLLCNNKINIKMFRRCSSKFAVNTIFTILLLFIIYNYLWYMISYVYDIYEFHQPPWPSKKVNVIKYENFISYEISYNNPKLLCWISTFSKNRLVSIKIKYFSIFFL